MIEVLLSNRYEELKDILLENLSKSDVGRQSINIFFDAVIDLVAIKVFVYNFEINLLLYFLISYIIILIFSFYLIFFSQYCI